MAAMNMNHEQFRQMMSEGKLMLVDYWAPWCGYCRRIGPAYDKVAAQYGADMVVAKVNIDDDPLLANQEHIEVIPTLVRLLPPDRPRLRQGGRSVRRRHGGSKGQH